MNFSNVFVDFSSGFEHTTFVLTALLFQFFPCLSSPMTPQSYCQYLKICVVKKLFLQYFPGGSNFSGLRVISKIVQ